MEFLICEFSLDDGNAPGFAGSNLHTSPSDVLVKLSQQTLGAWDGGGQGGQVIYVSTNRW